MFDKWLSYWFPESSLMRLAFFRVTMLILASRTLGVVKFQVFQLAESVPGSAGHFWNPIFVFELLGQTPPTVATVRFLGSVLAVATFTGVVGLFTRTSCLVAATLYFWFWGMAYSTGQAHHEKVVLVFALWALAFSPCGRRLAIDALLRDCVRAWQSSTLNSIPRRDTLAMWPLRFVQWSIAFGYVFAGLTKLARSGFEWMNGYTLQSFMLGSGAPWSSFFARSPQLCAAMSVGLIIVQVGFPAVLFWPKSRWFFLPTAASFHLLAMMTLGSGPYDTLWLVMIAFVPLDRVPSFLGLRLRQGAIWRRLLWLAAIGTPVFFYLAFLLPRVDTIYVVLIALALWVALRGLRSPPPRVLRYDARRRKERLKAVLMRWLDWNNRLTLKPQGEVTGTR